MRDAPFVSIVVPTRDRPSQLARCIDALAALEYPRDRLEVLIADDSGTVAVDGAARQPGVTVLRTGGVGPAAARNRAVESARGELLAFTDDDCVPAPDWLAHLARASHAAPGCAIGGRTVTAYPGNAGSAASEVVVSLVYAYYNSVPSDARFFASNNLAVPTHRFRELGGFDEQFRWSEDRDFCDRWLRHGRRFVYEPAAVVAHAKALTAGQFARQNFGYGRGAYAFHRGRSRPIAASVMRELGFYRALPELTVRALARRSGNRGRVAGMLAVWQAANAAGFGWEALLDLVGRRRRQFDGVPTDDVRRSDSAKVARA